MGIAEDLIILESRLKELVTRYDQYFIGLEKREPLKLADEVDKLVRRYASTPINNTMYKHRYNNLVARLNTYRQHWNRILREIEEGRYSRDRFRANLHESQRGSSSSQLKYSEQPSPKETDLDRVYAELVEARRSCKLPVDSITREQLAATLDKQRPLLTQRLGTNEIQFRVVIEDGKPKIKAGTRHKTSHE